MSSLSPLKESVMSDSSDRAAHVEALVQQLSEHAKEVVQQMAEELADLPDDELFGDIEYRLRDLGLELSRRAQQTAVDQDKKRGTKAPVVSAPTAKTTPASKGTPPSRSSS